MSAVQDINAIATTGDAWAGYVPPSDVSRPPEPNVYTFTRLLTEDYDFSKGRFDYKGVECGWYNFRAAIQGGQYNGRTAFGGANTLIGEFRAGCTVQDFILAAGASARPALTDLNAVDGVMEVTLGPFQARTDWEFRCKGCKETFLTGAKKPKVPKKYDGPKFALPKADPKTGLINHIQPCPTCKADVAANLKITTFIVPQGNAAPAKPIQQATTVLPPAAG